MIAGKSPRWTTIAGIVLLCALFLPMIVVSEAEAQGLKRLRNAIGKVEHKVQEKKDELIDNYVDNKISEKTEETLNKWFGIGKRPSQSSSDGMSGDSGSGGFGMFGTSMNAPAESVYEFDYRITYFIESVEKGTSTKMRMNTYVNSKESYFAIQMNELSGSSGSGSGPADAYMIMDQKNSVMVMLINENGQRSSMALSLPETTMDEIMESASTIGDESTTESSPMSLTAGFNAMYGYESIGSRSISGYDTQGFRMQEGRSQVEIWVTDEPIKG